MNTQSLSFFLHNVNINRTPAYPAPWRAAFPSALTSIVLGETFPKGFFSGDDLCTMCVAAISTVMGTSSSDV